MLKTTDAIQSFLKSVPVNYATDLTSRYTGDMECQVNVNPSDGEPVFNGTKLVNNTWSITNDLGTYQFYHIRVPKNSWSEPYYHDPVLNYPLQHHAQCIGMTGWNWKKKQSLWVAFDVDSITDHAPGVGISEEAMREVRNKACEIPWVQVRKSTGGAGIHFYIYFDPDYAPETENHTIHAAVARTVLGLMEKETGFDFRGNMDVLGGNMWIWHQKINEENNGLSIIKDFEDFCPRLPDNWRDNIDVVQGKAAKVRFKGVYSHEYNSFESQASSRAKVNIDEIHKEIENEIYKLGYTIIWVPDYHCYQTHTKALEELINKYPEKYKGIFQTLSQGTDRGSPNSFLFPLSDGGFRVTRFGRGAREHETWNQDGTDWTWTYFNRAPSLAEAARIFHGVQDPDGKGWIFTDFKNADKVCQILGDELPLDSDWLKIFGQGVDRKIILRPNKNKQLVIEIEKKKDDKLPNGWIEKGRKFIRLCRYAYTDVVKDSEELNLDDRVRALVDVNNEFSQWVVLSNDGDWVGQNKDNTRSALRIWSPDDVEHVLGKLIINHWKIVNVPFQPEYLGNRRWNRKAPQFAVTPGESGQPHDHWDLILDHCGQDLDDAISNNQWCREAGIHIGADYLKYWLSFMFRSPFCKLPYLFFHGPEGSGKSILHEAVSLLVTRGVVLAKEALVSKNNYNGELAGAVLCVVEEINLQQNISAVHERIKAWVTGEEILIHAKYQQPTQLKNTTHWMQMANNREYCPVFQGDTRIVMAHVPMFERCEIPKPTLLTNLQNEAPAFLRSLLDLKLPAQTGRLSLPIIETDSKKNALDASKSAVDKFIEEQCHLIDGAIIKFSDFYEQMKNWMADDQKSYWSYNRVADEFRNREILPFGRALNNINCIGNLSLYPKDSLNDYGLPWVRIRQKLERKIDESIIE